MTTSGERNRATMRQVAALAGVSLKTVSRVINDEPLVSPDLVERVRTAVRHLDYRPNLTASSLRRRDGLSRAIGLVLEDVANPFSAGLHRAVEDVAHERGVVVLAGSADRDPDRERRLVTAFGNRRVDGLIVVPCADDQSYLHAERRAGTPVVFVDRPPRFFDADVVLASNRQGAEDATAHLVAHGHRRIAFLGDNADIHTATERELGYRAALARAGVEDDSLVRRSLGGTEHARRVTHELLARDAPPTALFAGQNVLTIGCITALREAGRHRDVALVGFDDMPMADLLDPGVTVVAQDPPALGALAARLLFERIDGADTGFVRREIPCRLIARGSGEIAVSSTRGRAATGA